MRKKKLFGVLILLAVLLALGGGVAEAQTTTPTTTPGVPNTGAGSDAGLNLLLLGASGLVALAGGAYLLTKKPATK